MADITRIDKSKKKNDEKYNREVLIEEALNFDGDALFSEVNLDNGYPQSFKNAIGVLINTKMFLTAYDVSAIFNGLVENKKIPKASRKLADYIFREARFNEFYNNDLCKYKSASYRIDNPKTTQDKERVSRVEACYYYKAILEQPERITEYDVSIIAFSLKGMNDMPDEQERQMTTAISMYFDESYIRIITDNRRCKDSLLNDYIKMPKTVLRK